MWRIALIIIALLLAPGSASALVVEFQEKAAVADAVITLGDIATFDRDSEFSRALASQQVAQSPSPGDSLSLLGADVAKGLTATQTMPEEVIWKGSANITVSRSSQVITATTINDIIDGYLEKFRKTLAEAEVRFVPVEQPIPFALPVGEMTTEVIPANPAVIGSNRFAIIFRVDGRVRKNMSIRGHLEVLVPVAVSATALAKDTVLAAEHFTMVNTDISDLEKPCLDINEVVGKKLSRSLKAGTVLAMSEVVTPPLVRRGEMVKMIVRQGALELSATGIAHSDGAKDQTIRVENVNSNKIVYCRVSGPGLVEVTL